MKKNIFIPLLFITLFTQIDVSYCDENTPEYSYEAYLQAIKSSKSLKELNPYVSVNKSSVFDSLTEEQKQSALAFKKNIVENIVRINIKSDTNDKISTLIMEIQDKATGKKGTAIVKMVLEGGKWKIDEETFDFTNTKNSSGP